MRIVEIANGDKMNFSDLLLLADEDMNMIEKYLYRGEMFALYDGVLRAECVVTNEAAGKFELKNIAVKPEYQRRGYGKKLVFFILEHYCRFGKNMYVGTGDSLSAIRFYADCGFVYSHALKNFFVNNYDHPIIENGKILTDMIYLKKTL